MPRRREVPKRKIVPDPKYNSDLVAKFINGIMRRGKKSLAERILYGAFDLIHERTKEDPLRIFEKALGNVKPVVEVNGILVNAMNASIHETHMIMTTIAIMLTRKLLKI